MKADQFDLVYREYFDPVYRYALSLSGDAHAAEEITQETFFKAMRALDRFRGESSLKSWLFSIARNAWISELRRKKAAPLEQAEEAPDPGAGLEEALMNREDGLRIHRLLHDLPEPYREVFTLRALGQLGFRDIGELFGKSENWACVVYHRARAKIKEKMEEKP